MFRAIGSASSSRWPSNARRAARPKPRRCAPSCAAFAPTSGANGTGGFANALAPGGFFGIQQQGNVISLTYTVPEPSTYALLALAAGAAGYVRWRNRKKVS